jgi:hypothetical protein
MKVKLNIMLVLRTEFKIDEDLINTPYEIDADNHEETLIQK